MGEKQYGLFRPCQHWDNDDIKHGEMIAPGLDKRDNASDIVMAESDISGRPGAQIVGFESLFLPPV